MAVVSLKGMKFYAYHGYYEAERRIGTNFILDVDVHLPIEDDPNDEIEKTVNYEGIYSVCQRVMGQKYALLESVVYDIGQKIKQNHPEVSKVTVTLSKLNPPLPGKVEKAVVKIEL